MILDLFTRCVLISLLAFGGGGGAAAHRADRGSRDGVGQSAGFRHGGCLRLHHTRSRAHYHDVSGLSGGRTRWAVAATCGIFLMPWALAAAAAHLLRRWMQHPLLQHFGRGAAPAVVGLLVVTALHLAAAPSQARYMSALPLWP